MQQKTVVQVVSASEVENVIRLLQTEAALCDVLKDPYRYAGDVETVKFYNGQKQAYNDAVRYLRDMLTAKQYIEG